jgi:hypothetical protein
MPAHALIFARLPDGWSTLGTALMIAAGSLALRGGRVAKAPKALPS